MTQPADRRQPAEWWLAAVEREERRGELLAAFDLAERGLAEHPEDLPLKHRAVLALARAGATEEATRRFESYDLGRIRDEEVAALGARIAKDFALAAGGAERRRLAAGAADLYAAIFARTGGYYPAINAATLWLIAGDAPRARQLAQTVLEMLRDREQESYYAAATVAEALFVLGDEGAIQPALARAAALHGDDYGALATTRRQLRTICETLGVDADLLAPLAGPEVVHFCGHRVGDAQAGGRFPPEAQSALAAKIEEILRRERPGFAYGSLAAGADILWAEALLGAGAELHVVLPFALPEFLELSVRSSGEGWVERFHRCLDAATAVDYATDDAFLGDDVLFRYCSEFAMGLALLRARYLEAEVRQLALWDGKPAAGEAGTAIDVNTWRQRSRSLTILTPDGDEQALAAGQTPADDERHERSAPESRAANVAVASPLPPPGLTAPRVVRAMLFGDVKGFSRLTDEQLPVFAREVLGAFAAAVERHSDDVWHRNTWGDAVYVVLTNAAVAAACALDLQAAMGAIDLRAGDLPSDLALRLGGHLGPVFPTHDPVLDTLGFMGSHVSRTARIEPVTPPSAVYVTEPFAAALALDGGGQFACDYVGRMPAAKNYGVLRMYRLRRRGSGDANV